MKHITHLWNYLLVSSTLVKHLWESSILVTVFTKFLSMRIDISFYLFKEKSNRRLDYNGLSYCLTLKLIT